MKLFLWVLLGLTAAGTVFWMVASASVPRNPLVIAVFIAVFTAGPIGAFWMMYVSIRHEKHPLPMVVLAFLPYSFLWYYAERVRPKKHIADKRYA
jgi:hypothetical protein